LRWAQLAGWDRVQPRVFVSAFPAALIIFPTRRQQVGPKRVHYELRDRFQTLRRASGRIRSLPEVAFSMHFSYGSRWTLHVMPS
jgi:hypothetical protein